MPPQPSALRPRAEEESHRFVSARVIIVDDTEQLFFPLSSSKWRVQPDTQWHGGTISSYIGTSTNATPSAEVELVESLSLSVIASSISLVGVVPPNSTQPFYVSINDSPPTAQTLASASLIPEYREWFTTPFTNPEPKSRHNMTFYNLPDGLSIDYALLTHGYVRPQAYVGPRLDFQIGGGIGRLVVDDSDPSIEWVDGSGSGVGWNVIQKQWNVSASGSAGTGSRAGMMADAYGQTVHASSTVGSSATVYFSGTEMSLYGLRPRGITSGGTISVSYRVDKGQEVLRNYAYNFDQSASEADESFQQHFELYGVKGLEDGPHMLEFNITSITTSPSASTLPPPTFYIDYLTYTTETAPFVHVASADGVQVPTGFLQKMEISYAPDTGLKPQYIVGIVVLVVACVVLAWHGRRYLVIGLACLLRAGDKRKAHLNDVSETVESKGGPLALMKSASRAEKGQKRQRKRGVIQRLAETVRLDLEFSWVPSGRVLRSTILDIRPRTPPPTSPPGPVTIERTCPIATSPAPQIPAPALLPSPRPFRPLPALPDTPPVYSEHPTQLVNPRPPPQPPRTGGEVQSVRAYLSRINVRLATALAGAGAAGRDWVLGSMSRGWGSRGPETLPEYRSFG